jgi:tetratricopeptide (TPR) repeat protein
MHHKSTIIFLTIIILVLFVPKWTNAGPFQENPLTKAILLFDKGNFKEAEPLFKKILDERPDDFMVNYFYGACRTENGHYSDQDLSYLLKASKEVTPLDIDYYFGIQYHAKNQWEKALGHYKLFQAVTSVNDQEKVNLSLKMEQCSNKINPFTPAENEITSVKLNAVTETVADSVETIDNLQEIRPDSEITLTDTTTLITELQEIIEEEEEEEETINFNINDEITYIYVSHFKTAEGEIYYKEGSSKQKELDETLKLTEELREKYKASESSIEKDSIGKQILESESKSYELRNVVKQLLLQAKTAESGYWQNATPQETENFIRELNAAEQKIKEKNAKQDVIVAESPEMLIPPVIQDEKTPERSAPKQSSSGITYKIQIGAYSRGIPNNMKSVFNKITMIRKVQTYTDEKGVVVYTTGNLTNYEDAVVMQKQVQQEGIKDAIIAAYLNGKRITLEQAKEIETEK